MPDAAALEFLKLVAGVSCPCGHEGDDHAPPTSGIKGEKWGDCSHCECRGLIDCYDEEDWDA